MEKFDLCVIGGGPAGYAAAMRALDLGKKVILVEKDKVGGAGVYDGALASKTMWELASKISDINETIVSKGRPQMGVSWQEAQQTVNEAIFDRKYQYACHLKLLEEEVDNPKFTYARGFGKMLDKNTVEITNKKGKKSTISTDYILIATGSRPRELPEIPADENIILTSNGIHHIKDYPKSIVILGAGVIGCEYATIFASMGKTKVHIIDRANRILPFEDEDIAETIMSNFEAMGVVVHREAALDSMEIENGEVKYVISYPDGSKETHYVEKALLSVGRVPNVEGIGMEDAGVSMSKRGRHIGDDDTQTNVPNIYVAGDASGRIALVNMGEIEGRHAVERMFLNTNRRLSYNNVSTIMFLKPEVAGVGMNEQQAKQENKSVRVVKLDYSTIARAIAMRKTQGFFKIIVSDDDEMKILGMRAVGAHASSAIQAVALLISMNKGISELAELIHPHPSIIEGIQECVRMLLGKSVFKKEVFGDKMKCYRLINGTVEPMNSLIEVAM